MDEKSSVKNLKRREGKKVKSSAAKKLALSRRSLSVLILIAPAAVIIALYTVLASFTPLPRLYTGLVLLAIYLVTATASVLIMKPKIDLEIKESELHPLLGEIMLSSMSEVSTPALIADKSAKVIIWYNREAGVALGGSKTLRGAKVSDILRDTKESDTGELTASVSDKIYRVSVSDITAGNKTYELYSFSDITESERMSDYISKHEVMVAYIMVDNLDEMLQHEQEEYRYAASATERILRNWATESGGILKEYQTDRYIFIFEAEKFREFEKNKFEILDKVRDVRVGTGSIPITISIGISDTGGETFADREKGAQGALETALQRGGDQAVVKNRDGSYSIYGGKTKTVQKKTNVRARIVANEILMRISESSNVIIMAHKRPDFDAIGASLGMARFAMFCGVPVNVVTDFSFGGVEKCLERIKDEPDYEGVLVDKETALDLVSPDTLLIIVDVNNPAVYEEPHLADSCRNIIVIDHHRKTAEFSREPLLSYIEPSASATCELVCGMLEQCIPEELILPREADIMFAGILLDTNQFRKNTGTRTFGAALYLRQRGADIAAVQEFFKTSIEDYERENKFRTNVSIYRKVTAISIADGDGDAGDNIPASKAADKLLELEGIKASFVLVKIKDSVHISARSVGEINVQLILEQLKGGGHFDAAGAQIKDTSVENVAELLKGAIDKYLDENTGAAV